MAKLSIDKKTLQLLFDCSEPARHTGKTVRQHLARRAKLQNKITGINKRLRNILRCGTALRLEVERLQKRRAVLRLEAVKAWRDAAAQYKWDRRQAEKPARLAAGCRFGPGRFFINGEQVGTVVNFNIDTSEARAALDTVRKHADQFRAAVANAAYPRFVGMSPALGMGYGEDIKPAQYHVDLYRRLFGGRFASGGTVTGRMEGQRVGLVGEEGCGYSASQVAAAAWPYRGTSRVVYRDQPGSYPDPVGDFRTTCHGERVAADSLKREWIHGLVCRMDFSKIEERVLAGLASKTTTNKENNTMSSVKLTAASVGQKFNCRDGRIAEVVYHNTNPGAPADEFVIRFEVKGKPGQFTTRNVGSDGMAYPGAGINFELMSAYVPFKVKVGGIYQTRDGKSRAIATRETEHGVVSVRWIGGALEGYCANHCHADGHTLKGVDSPNDLVESKLGAISLEEMAAANMLRLVDEMLRGKNRITDCVRKAQTRDYPDYIGGRGTVHQSVLGYTTEFRGAGFEFTVKDWK